MDYASLGLNKLNDQPSWENISNMESLMYLKGLNQKTE